MDHFGPPRIGGSPINGGFSAMGSFRPEPMIPRMTNDVSGTRGGAALPTGWKGFSGH
jgi:hypothetical protein